MAGAQVVEPPPMDLNTGLVIDSPALLPLAGKTELNRVEGAPTELTDFALSFVIGAKHLPASVTFVLGQPVVVTVAGDGQVTVALEDKQWTGRPDVPPLGRALAVVLSVKRDARQAVSTLSLDGIERMTLAVPPAKLKLKATPGRESDAEGAIAHVRLYNRLLGTAEVRELARLALRPPPQLAPFAGSLDLIDHEVLAVLGGTEANALIEDGSLEAALAVRFPDKHLRLRNLTWETDTVWRQDRPMNFGDLSQQLHRAEATAVVLMFGRQECLERGAAGVAEFRAGLEKMLATCARLTPRLWLVGPAPFGKTTPPHPDLAPRNEPLKLYTVAIQDLATVHHALFTDALGAEVQTRDGLTLTEADARRLGTLIGGVAPGAAALLPVIQAKNKLWHDYWRPSNWAFLYGDRTTQPSSRDHLNPNVRWFPQELEQYRALIDAKENELWKLSQELGRKLP